MWISNLPKSLFEIALKASGGADGSKVLFQKGEIVEGHVIKNISSKQALVRLNGMDIVANTKTMLKKGHGIVGKVESLMPHVTISLLTGTTGKEGKASELIRLYLPSKTPMGEAILKVTAQAEKYSLTPKGKDAIQSLTKAVESFASKRLGDMTPASVKESIAKSGLFLEANLKDGIASKMTQAQIAQRLEGDLKAEFAKTLKVLEGETSRIAKEIEELAVPEKKKAAATIKNLALKAESPSGKADLITPRMEELSNLREALKDVKTVLNNIELNQLLNSPVAREAGGAQTNLSLFQIPFLQGNILETAKVYIQPKENEDEGGNKQNKKGESSIVFMLSMSLLGPVRVDVSVGKEKATGTIYVLNEKVASFIKDNLDELTESLSVFGYRTQFDVVTSDEKKVTQEIETMIPIVDRGLINVKA